MTLLYCWCAAVILAPYPSSLSYPTPPRTKDTATTTFPTLDISPILSPGTLWNDDVPDVVDALRMKISETMEKWGGFFATGHGLEKQEMIDILRKEARDFFSMNTEEKEKLQITACNPLGWSRREKTKVVQRDDERLTTHHPLDNIT